MDQTVVFRLDDICEEMDYNRFLRIRELFDRYEVKPIIGVVPHNDDPGLCVGEEIPGFWTLVRSLQESGWTIAQHGYNHVYTNRRGGRLVLGKKSEFAGIPYEEQLRKIQTGKEILRSHGITTDVFFAPSHSYDDNTLRALNVCGFHYVSDGMTNHPYRYMNLTHVPCKDYKLCKRNRFMCVCYHPNEMGEDRFQETERFLSEYRSRIITFEQAASYAPQPYTLARLHELAYILLSKYIVLVLYRIYMNLLKKYR